MARAPQDERDIAARALQEERDMLTARTLQEGEDHLAARALQEEEELLSAEESQEKKELLEAGTLKKDEEESQKGLETKLGTEEAEEEEELLAAEEYQEEKELLGARTLKGDEEESQNALEIKLRTEDEYFEVPANYLQIPNPLSYEKVQTPSGEKFVYPIFKYLPPQDSFVERPPLEPHKRFSSFVFPDSKKPAEVPPTASEPVIKYVPQEASVSENIDIQAQLRIDHGVTTDAQATTRLAGPGKAQSGPVRASSYHMVRGNTEERPVVFRLSKVRQSRSWPMFI